MALAEQEEAQHEHHLHHGHHEHGHHEHEHHMHQEAMLHRGASGSLFADRSADPPEGAGEAMGRQPSMGRRSSMRQRLHTVHAVDEFGESHSDGEETPLAHHGNVTRVSYIGEDGKEHWTDYHARHIFGAGNEPDVDEEQRGSCWAFVGYGSFQLLSASIIFVNTIMIAAEMQSPWWKRCLHMPDQFVLAFYVFELVGRLSYFRRRFFMTSWHMVAWNMLDLVVVVAGVTDQWILPWVVGNSSSNGFLSSIRALRLLRLLRVLKMVRLLLEADLAWTEEPWFESFIGLVIVFNAAIMGLETDNEWYGWFYIEQVLLVIYTFELSVRLKRLGFHFFYGDGLAWNLLDFAIVSSSVMDSWLIPLAAVLLPSSGSGKRGMVGKTMVLMRMLRLMRILRLVRVIKSVRPLFNLVMGVVAAMQGVGWVLVLTLVTLYAAGILATRLIGHGDILPEGVEIDDEVLKTFSGVLQSMFVLFRVMNGSQSDEESYALDTLMENIPSVKFAFVFFFVAFSWTLLSILTAVVSDNMICVTTEQALVDQRARSEESRQIRMAALQDLFKDIDEDGSGTLEGAELEQYMKDPHNASRWEDISGIPLADVPTLLSTIGTGTEPVELDFFIDILTDSAETSITERAVLKLRGEMETHVTEFKAFQKQQQTWQADVMTLLRLIAESTKPQVHMASQRAIADATAQAFARSLSLAQVEQTKVLNKILEAVQLRALPIAAECAGSSVVSTKGISWEEMWERRQDAWERKQEAWQASLLEKIGDIHRDSRSRALSLDVRPKPNGWLASDDLFQRL